MQVLRKTDQSDIAQLVQSRLDVLKVKRGSIHTLETHLRARSRVL